MSSNSAVGSASELPRKALEKDLSGTRNPLRVPLPAVGVAGIFGLGAAVLGFLLGEPKNFEKTLVEGEFPAGSSSSKLFWARHGTIEHRFNASGKAQSRPACTKVFVVRNIFDNSIPFTIQGRSAKTPSGVIGIGGRLD